MTSCGGAGLGDATGVEDDDPVGEHRRVDRVMGDEHSDTGEGGEVAAQIAANLVAGGRVERGERFVEQQQRRFEGEGPGQRHPLGLAARELIGPGGGAVGQADAVEPAGRSEPGVPAPAATAAKTEGHVVERRRGGGTAGCPGTRPRRPAAPAAGRCRRRGRRGPRRRARCGPPTGPAVRPRPPAGSSCRPRSGPTMATVSPASTANAMSRVKPSSSMTTSAVSVIERSATGPAGRPARRARWRAGPGTARWPSRDSIPRA